MQGDAALVSPNVTTWTKSNATAAVDATPPPAGQSAVVYKITADGRVMDVRLRIQKDVGDVVELEDSQVEMALWRV